MVENKSESLSTALLENQGREAKVKTRSEAFSGVTAQVGMVDPELKNTQSWTLVERARVIKAILGQEINSQQENLLKLEQIDLILTTIIDLERLRPLDHQLSLDEVLAILITIIKKSYTGDRFQMILEEVQRLENDPNLKETMKLI